MITVRYDREIFLLQRYGGVSKYYSKIIEQFFKHSNLNITPDITFKRTDNYHLLETLTEFEIKLKSAKYFINSKSGWSTLFTYGPLRSLMSAYSAGVSLHPKQCDILHATYYRPEFFEKINCRKKIVTVHDFIPEKLGWKGFRNPHIGKHHLVAEADGIICVSQQTANDLKYYYGIDDERVVVIHHGVSFPQFVLKSDTHFEYFRPYFLYVGHRSGYKNFNVLVKAMKIIRKQHPEIELKIAGSLLLSSEIAYLNQELGELNWSGITSPDNSKLQKLFFNCLAFCTTSKYEGFGMTILEAMSCNAPVIASDTPIHREIAGTGALYFNPDSYQELNIKLQMVLDDKIRKNLIADASIKVKEYSWTKSALEHAQFYERIIQ